MQDCIGKLTKSICSTTENDALQETVNSKDKELQKVGKLMKLPGFQGFQVGCSPFFLNIQRNELM